VTTENLLANLFFLHDLGDPSDLENPTKIAYIKYVKQCTKAYTVVFLLNKVLKRKKKKKPHLQFHLFDLHLLEGQQDLEFLDPPANLVNLQGQVHHDHPAKHNFSIIHLKKTGLDQSNMTLALLI